MAVLTENIKNITRIEHNDISNVSLWLFDAVKVSTQDNESSIEHKIELLQFLLDYLPKTININSLATKTDQIAFIKLLSKLTDVKEELELLIGKITIEELEAIGKNFAKKTQYPVGDLEAF
jgi:hypothetical protein